MDRRQALFVLVFGAAFLIYYVSANGLGWGFGQILFLGFMTAAVAAAVVQLRRGGPGRD